MAMRSCRVTIQDLDGVAHTVEVTASTLYEAVAQGLAAIRGREWVAGLALATPRMDQFYPLELVSLWLGALLRCSILAAC